MSRAQKGEGTGIWLWTANRPETIRKDRQDLTNRIGKAQKRRSGERQARGKKDGEEFRILRITELSY